MLANKLLGAAAAAVPQYVEDVFSTYLYTGTGTDQTITNGIDLSGKGGLVWTKCRSAGQNNSLVDTVRGGSSVIFSNTTDAAVTSAARLSFGSSGYDVLSTSGTGWNTNAATYASWTFRKQSKFFDVVTYTGTGSSQTISHNLGSLPGFIIIKETSAAEDWYVLASDSSGNYQYLPLNNTASTQGSTVKTSTASSTTVDLGVIASTVGTSVVNESSQSYVMYLFASDAGGFGVSGSDNVVTCSSYTGNGSATGPTITLGYEPQFVMIKRSSTSGTHWEMMDSMRGMVVGGNDAILKASQANAESSADYITPTATGFIVTNSGTAVNANGDTYIYIAIRRPMKTPTSGTSVYSGIARSGTGASATVSGVGFAPDFVVSPARTNGYGTGVYDRLRGANNVLVTTGTAAEVGDTSGLMSFTMDGITVGSDTAQGYINATSITYINYFFRRAPGFFDVVCDTGTASGHTINHGLTVVPELMIRKKRNSATNSDWVVWHTLFSGTNKYVYLNDNAAEATNSAFWTSTAPTSTVFSVGTGSRVNNSGDTYVTYLFATVVGVSKVGSYTGTGTTLTIDCGFTAGARFVMIKRTSSTGDWYVWDTARGIISGNDPYLLLNSTAAEVTNTDYIDPVNSGFQISSTAPVQINQSGGTFIFLAIA
jgi:hypothetical protein